MDAPRRTTTDDSGVLPHTAPRGWVDVHNHLLPGLDDGPATDAEAMALCRSLVAEGVTHAAATPHLFGPYTELDRAESIVAAAQRLASAVARAELPLTLYVGADTRIDDRLVDALQTGVALPLGRGGRYVLIEPPHDVWIDAPAVCAALDAAGYVGVLTHPERHPHLARHGAAPLQAWVDRGAVIQVTAGSLLGDFGKAAEELGWAIVESPVPAVVASDAHDTRRRPVRIGAAAVRIAARLGYAAADRLCRATPWSLLADARSIAAGAARPATEGVVS